MGAVNHVLAFDPGRITGWARFKSRKLSEAGFESFEKLCTAFPPLTGESVIIEMPRWYPHERRIDVNDLLDLCRMVGRIEQRYWGEAQTVYPRTWKGSVPKDVHNKRVLAALTDEERALLPRRPRAKDFDHNLVDAVGLGLWKLGRMT